MKPYVQYMHHLLTTISDTVSDDEKFELSYNDYLQVQFAASSAMTYPVLHLSLLIGLSRSVGGT
jgi:hypothetical protein